MVALLWFRRDLRLADNPALTAALAAGHDVVPVYVREDADAGDQAQGAAARWWLHGSLASLAGALRACGSGLVLRSGPADAAIARLVAETGATAVYWNRCYEPWSRHRDERLMAGLKADGLDVRSFNAGLLAEPWTLATRNGQPYRVFTPFNRALRALGDPPAPTQAPDRIAAPQTLPASETLESWALRPTRPDWAGGLRDAWVPGEAAARARLAAFLDGALAGYRGDRNLPAVPGTSRLSPHLHVGEIGPRQVWHAVAMRAAAAGGISAAADAFLDEIAWREFAHHLLFHFPTMPAEPLRPEFAAFPWLDDPARLTAWQRGATGYPIVDAGMRELWTTGWMHNRVRMIVASFLVKDLLSDWRHGAAWFWDTLVDADLANNAASWQWVAGCGTDAAPYFRIFNPSLQGAKFDPEGAYVRRWVPALSALPARWVHTPWEAPPLALRDAGVTLGKSYPARVVDHAVARRAALDAFRHLKAAP